MPDENSCQLRLEDGCLLISIVNHLASLDAGQTALRNHLTTSGVSERAAYQTELAFEELITNVMRHGYADMVSGSRAIDISVQVAEGEIRLIVEDDGPPFDPVQAPEIPLATRLEDAVIGGLGLRFIRNAAKRIGYQRIASRNRVTVWVDNR